jgi:hypothetical protein
LGWTLGDRGTQTAERLAAQLPHAPQVKFATDCWHPYAKIFGGQNHVQGKAHTFTIESLNNPHPVLLGPPQAPDAQLQQVQGKSGRQLRFFIVNQCGGKRVSKTQSIPV